MKIGSDTGDLFESGFEIEIGITFTFNLIYYTNIYHEWQRQRKRLQRRPRWRKRLQKKQEQQQQDHQDKYLKPTEGTEVFSTSYWEQQVCYIQYSEVSVDLKRGFTQIDSQVT